MKNVENRVQDALNALPKHWIILLEVDAEKAGEAGRAAVKHLTGKGLNGIIVSANRPCPTLFEFYDEEDIDREKLFIVDLVCKTQTNKPPEEENVAHLENASSLTNISLTLNEVFASMRNNAFLLLDSLTTMLIHNDPKILARFVHGVMTRARLNKVNAVFLAVKGETDERVRAEVAQLCDKVITL